VLIAAVPVHAQDKTFAQLLTQAKAQAAAGHRWAPAGDNMTETAIRMIDLMPKATPAELAEFLSLLQSDKQLLPPAYARSDVPVAEQPTQSMPARASGYPSVIAALPRTPPPSSSEQSRQANPGQSPSGTMSIQTMPSHGAPGQRAPSGTMSIQTMPGEGATDQGASDQGAPSQTTPGQTTPGQTMPDRALPDASNNRASQLYARGLDAELRGDLSGARRFYSTAARLGDAASARNLGRLYDPAYIKHAALGGIDPDPALARTWYERAINLGDADAEPLLEALSVR
jgi:hypothetical protein